MNEWMNEWMDEWIFICSAQEQGHIVNLHSEKDSKAQKWHTYILCWRTELKSQ